MGKTETINVRAWNVDKVTPIGVDDLEVEFVGCRGRDNRGNVVRVRVHCCTCGLEELIEGVAIAEAKRFMNARNHRDTFSSVMSRSLDKVETTR